MAAKKARTESKSRGGTKNSPSSDCIVDHAALSLALSAELPQPPLPVPDENFRGGRVIVPSDQIAGGVSVMVPPAPDSAPVPVPVAAGDFIVSDPRVIHGCHPTRSFLSDPP